MAIFAALNCFLHAGTGLPSLTNIFYWDIQLNAYRSSSAIGKILTSKVRKEHRQSPAAFIMAKLVCIGRLFLKHEKNSIGLAVNSQLFNFLK
jgi:hypothetical protein